MDRLVTLWYLFTLASGKPTNLICAKTSMFVPDPVISLAIKPVGKETTNFSRALNRFQKEDPTFKVHLDHESKEAWVILCFSR